MGTIRSDWLARADAAVEQLADDLTSIDVRNSQFLLRHFVDSLEPPPDALHGAVLSTILMDACERIVHALHDQNPPATCACEATIWSHVSRFAKWRDADPRVAFRDWLDVFFADIATAHPADLAVQTAQIIRQDPTRSWTSDALAAAVESNALTLRRAFQSRFGMRLTEYVHLARVAKAIALLRSTSKVETVARDLGYRSKKDLYAALNRWADATPTQLRALSDDECQWLERQLRIRCLRGIGQRTVSVRTVLPPTLETGGGRGAAGTRAARRQLRRP